jgi:hypothetical protein
MPKVKLDGGHGGSDPGASGVCGTPEKTVNLIVAKLVAAKLAPYMEVSLTREEDVAVDLHARGPQANAWGADFFVSIHCNSAANLDAHGIEVFHYPTDDKGQKLAGEVLSRLVAVTGLTNRGIKTEEFAVLKETSMPAILIEMAFISNAAECAMLIDPVWQDKLATAIAEGCMAYAGVTATPTPQPQGTLILSPARATVEQAKEWAKNRQATTTFVELAEIFWSLAPATGVDPAVAYCQAAKETGFGRFGGVINETYHNTCGLKIPAGGGNYDPNAHKVFPSWEEGIQAHLDHIALYAGAPGYPKADSPDPRHFTWIAGKSKTVEGLGGNWAPATDYGTSIVEKYLQPLMSTVVPLPEPPQVPQSSDGFKTSWEKACHMITPAGTPLFDGTNPQGTVTRDMLCVILDRLGLLR